MPSVKCAVKGCKHPRQAGARYCSPECRAKAVVADDVTIAGSMLVSAREVASTRPLAMLESTTPARAHRAPRQDTRRRDGCSDS